MRFLNVVLLAAVLSGCATERLVPAEGGGVAFSTEVAPSLVRAEVLALAAELGYPARERDGVVEIEVASAPMSERFSRWLRVAIDADGTGSAVTVRTLPAVEVPPTGNDRRRRRSRVDADYFFADALAERLRDTS